MSVAALMLGLGVASCGPPPTAQRSSSQQTPLPHADVNQFSVVVAGLDGDENNAVKKVIVQSLMELTTSVTGWPAKPMLSVQVLQIDRTLRVADDADQRRAIERAHDTAKGWLRTMGASMLVWGRVLAVGSDRAPVLYLTSGDHGSAGRQYGLAQRDLKLPSEWQAEMGDMLRLVVFSQYADFALNRGQYVADRLPPFIGRVESLSASKAFSEWSPIHRATLLLQLGDAYFVLGSQTGDRGALDKAVATLRGVPDLLKDLPQESKRSMLFAAHQLLGLATVERGELSGGTSLLEEAVVNFKLALDELTREDAPFAWAEAQSNLGSALSALGERENTNVHLDQAVLAFESALREFTRECMPLQWASNQAELAGVLSELGHRESGTTHLEQAVAGYQNALLEIHREKLPFAWALAQNSLGNALTGLVRRKWDAGRMEQAITAFQRGFREGLRQPTLRSPEK